MKQVPPQFLADLEEQASMAMDVDDVDPLDVFGESLMNPDNPKIADADFFNSFADDFDDTDIN